MLNLIDNLARAAVSVALSPIAMAIDIWFLIRMAVRGRSVLDPAPLELTEFVLTNVGHCAREAIRPARR